MKLSYIFQSQYTFEGQKSYENVQIFLYRHWFVLISRLIVYAIMGLAPFVLYIFAGKYLSGGLSVLYWFLVSLYFLFWWYRLFFMLTMYLLDTWTVTDHRIVDSEQHGFFRRTVAELNLAKIQDISVTVKGVIPTFLGFGNIEIETAGADRKFCFKQIPNPYNVKDIIMEAHRRYMSEHAGGREVHSQDGV